MGTSTKPYAFAALAASLFIFLLLGCEPESKTAVPMGISTGITPLSVTGFTPTATSDPNGTYSLITDISSLKFSSDYADGGEASIDLGKPVYKLDVVSGGQTVTWYLWASLNPSRYVLSRSDVGDGWYFDDTSPAADTPNIGGSWKKVAADTSSQDLIADPTKATAEANAQVALLPKNISAAYDEAARTLTISVTFGVPVTVDTSGGTPTFRVTVSKTVGIHPTLPKAAAFVRGSGTDTLVFESLRERTVWGRVGYDQDPIRLNGGSITYGASAYAVAQGGIAARTNIGTIPLEAVAVGIATTMSDSQFTASSTLTDTDGKNYLSSKGRLNGPEGWVAGSQTSSEYYWKVDMSNQRTVVRIATQGVATRDTWIKTYKLQYSNDNANWTDYANNSGGIISANADRDTVITWELTPFDARYVRIVPQSWNGTAPGGRFELYEAQ